jgi:hypothetical protein
MSIMAAGRELVRSLAFAKISLLDYRYNPDMGSDSLIPIWLQIILEGGSDGLFQGPKGENS